MHYKFHFMLSLTILCPYFFYTETQIINEALIFKRKILSKLVNQIQSFIMHCVQLNNLTAVAHAHHTESS